MSTLHFVDPAAREIVASIPVFDPECQPVAQFRSDVLAMYAQVAPPMPEAREERAVPGSEGAPGVRVLIYRPDAAQAIRPAILYLHGGGMIAGAPEMVDAASMNLAREHGTVVVAADYRKAPETSFPGPIEDCYAALDWVFRHATEIGVDPSRIIVMGHSSGGGLAAATALLARDRNQHRLAGQVLIYPMLDPRTGTPEAPNDNPTTGEFMWNRKVNQFGWNALRGAAPVPPERLAHFAPALAQGLGGLPPAFIAVGSLDLFLEEDVAYAMQLSRAGVPVELHVYGGGVHGFDGFPGKLAEQFATDLKAAVRRLLHAF